MAKSFRVEIEAELCVCATCTHSYSFFLIGVFEFGTRGSEVQMECTPKVRQAIKGPATLNGGEQCWCPDKSIPVN
jgi:hypothetical protein